MNLLLLEPGERELPASDPRARHLRKILRAGPGDRLRAGEVDGSLGVAHVLSAGGGSYHLSFEPTESARPLAPVELLLGHPRPIVLRRLLRDLASIGPASIVVTPTDLGEQSYYASNMWDDARTPLVEGAAQGGTTRLPKLVRAPSLESALGALAAPHTHRFVLHAESAPDDPGSPPPLLTGLLDRSARGDLPATARPATPAPVDPPGTRVAVAVGSERGWTPDELARLRAAGFVECTLGGAILRTETAALISTWAAVTACGGVV